MANSKRREKYTDSNGNMFIPMNVEGGQWNEHFITTTKLMYMVGIIFGYIAIWLYLGSVNATVLAYILCLVLWTIVSVQVTRFGIFEEKFYFRMYKELKQNEVCTPALFWNIASLEDTDRGALITYSNARVAMMLKVDRDTITGKKEDFQERHYDAISDFYHALADKRLNFVQLNIMEQAGKDKRLESFSKLIHKSDNPNIERLMELEIGYIKNITRNSLYETDYFLVYSTDTNVADTLIENVCECASKLLEGAYMGYSVLTAKGISEFVKEEYGVEYFNPTQASLYMFRRLSGTGQLPFNISGIEWNDGLTQMLNPQEVTKVRNIASGVIDETLEQSEVSFKTAVYRKEKKKNLGIDFSTLAQGDASYMQSKKPMKKVEEHRTDETPEEDETVDFGSNPDESIDYGDEYIDI